MKLTKEQLETLSNCILSQMQIVRGTSGLSTVLDIAINQALEKLQALNHIICNELEKKCIK